MPELCPTCGQPKLPLLRTLELAKVLTHRELQVARLRSDGLTVDEIAQQLGIHPKTVETHLRNIKLKLNVGNAAQLSRLMTRAEEDARQKPSDLEIQALATLIQHQTAIIQAKGHDPCVLLSAEYQALAGILQTRGVVEKAMAANG